MSGAFFAYLPNAEILCHSPFTGACCPFGFFFKGKFKKHLFPAVFSMAQTFCGSRGAMDGAGYTPGKPC